MNSTPPEVPSPPSLATLGAGCFWCIEAVLQQIPGILGVRSGYMGGATPNPTYQAVCSGTTGHAEVVQLEFDADRISYAEVLTWFFDLHDPTTLNRQGNDVGTQYRSVIFFHDDEQREIAENVKSEVDSTDKFSSPIVTEIAPATEFFEAEDYHQDYYRRNKRAPYCQVMIVPKLKKLKLPE